MFYSGERDGEYVDGGQEVCGMKYNMVLCMDY